MYVILLFAVSISSLPILSSILSLLPLKIFLLLSLLTLPWKHSWFSLFIFLLLFNTLLGQFSTSTTGILGRYCRFGLDHWNNFYACLGFFPIFLECPSSFHCPLLWLTPKCHLFSEGFLHTTPTMPSTKDRITFFLSLEELHKQSTHHISEGFSSLAG